MRMAGAGSLGTRFRMMPDLIVLWCLARSHFMSFEHDTGKNKDYENMQKKNVKRYMQ